MLNGATQRLAALHEKGEKMPVKIRRENALAMSLADNSLDTVLVGFGLKTLSFEQQSLLADELLRVLKPGGRFSMVDISVPASHIVRWPYLFYLNRLVPIFGKLLLGNPENYRMLGVYTTQFRNSRRVYELFRSKGFSVTYHSLFFGCASGITGMKLVELAGQADAHRAA
jgi:demethylmenaquinone methyltransferase/2-methoxy-6-polyprenyl-1,4-benzoquinol methylase